MKERSDDAPQGQTAPTKRPSDEPLTMTPERMEQLRQRAIHGAWDNTEDFPAAWNELDAQRERVARLEAALRDFGEHDRRCPLARWEAGRPTASGGYEIRYAGAWYEAKPVDRTPPCSCGLAAALSDAPPPQGVTDYGDPFANWLMRDDAPDATAPSAVVAATARVVTAAKAFHRTGTGLDLSVLGDSVDALLAAEAGEKP